MQCLSPDVFRWAQDNGRERTVSTETTHHALQSMHGGLLTVRHSGGTLCMRRD